MTAAAAAAASKSRHGCNPWPDLPSELLGLVLLRLPSHADRVRLRAVCRPWRANARLQSLPRPLPWIALPDGDFLSLSDGVVRRLPVDPVPDDIVSQRLSTGSTLFLVRRDDDTCCLLNPWLSSTASAMTPLPELDFCFPKAKLGRGKTAPPPAPEFVKVVASDHLVTALTGDEHVAVSTRRPPQGPASSCSSAAAKWAPPRGGVAIDIALFKEKLYVLTMEQGQEELHVLDDDEQQTIKSVQCIRSTARIAVDHDDDNYIGWHDYDDNHIEWFYPGPGDWNWTDRYDTHERRYLVPSGDRLLLLVKRMINIPWMLLSFDQQYYEKKNQTCNFEVFEAAGLSGGGHGRWSKVDTLMGHALFVSCGCCKSLPPVVAAAGGQCGGALLGAQEDSIYYLNEETREGETRSPIYRNWRMTTTTYQNPIVDSGVYNMRDGTVMALPLKVTEAPQVHQGPWHPTWLFPAE